jgi:hypothetical protein
MIIGDAHRMGLAHTAGTVREHRTVCVNREAR